MNNFTYGDDVGDGDNTDDIDLLAYDDTGLLALASREEERSLSPQQTADVFMSNSNKHDSMTMIADADDDDDDGGEWDNVAWEDVDDDSKNDDDDRRFDDDDDNPFPYRGVMIDFGSKNSGKSNNPDDNVHNNDDECKPPAVESVDANEVGVERKRKSKTTRVLRNIPHDTQLLIQNVRRTLLLCNIYKCAFWSSIATTVDPGSECNDVDDGRRRLLTHLAYSLIPQQFHNCHHSSSNNDNDNDDDDDAMMTTIRKSSANNNHTSIIPTKVMVQEFATWCIHFLNEAGERRRSALRRNIAQGAAADVTTPTPVRGGERKRRCRKDSVGLKVKATTSVDQRVMSLDNQYYDGSAKLNSNSTTNTTSTDHLTRLLTVLSPQYDDDPQLYNEELLEDGSFDNAIDAVERITAHEKTLLFLIMTRSLGWRVRYVESLTPLPLELTVDHPLLLSTSPASLLDMKKQSALKSGSNGFNCEERLHQLCRILIRQHRRSKRRKVQVNDTPASCTSMNEPINLLSDCNDDDGDGVVAPKVKRLSTTLPISPQENHNKVCTPILSWVEVLCRVDEGIRNKCTMKTLIAAKSDNEKCISKTTAASWIPIDIEHECIDKPENVESTHAWMESRVQPRSGKLNNHNKRAAMTCNISQSETSSVKKMKMSPKSVMPNLSKRMSVSYVLAVEHFSDNGDSSSRGQLMMLNGAHFVDVTPRYANTWSRTLRLRGASGKEVTSGCGKCVDEWWKMTLQQLNSVHRRGASTLLDRASNNSSKIASTTKVRSVVTKTTTKAGKEMEMIEFESSDDEDKKDSISKQHHQHPDNDEEEDLLETRDLVGILEREKIPTSKAGFKQSPFYVIPSILNSQDVLHPDAKKHICGVFKGELVYRRSDVSKALKSSKWLYQGRKVKDCEIGNPVKQVKTRKKPSAAAASSSKNNFQALSSYGISEEAQLDMISTINDKNKVNVDGIGAVCDDNGMDNLYGKWQTVSWSPPYVGPNDIIPTNDYRNVELSLLNPGLSHLDQTGLAPIAKKLGIPYAPCMLGYEGSHVIVRGIVVHDHNVTLIREASVEMQSFTIEKEIQDKRNAVIHRWKRLVVGLLTKERLDRAYG